MTCSKSAAVEGTPGDSVATVLTLVFRPLPGGEGEGAAEDIGPATV